MKELESLKPETWTDEEIAKVFDREPFESKIDELIDWLYDYYNRDFGVYVGMADDKVKVYPLVVTIYAKDMTHVEELVAKSHLNNLKDKF